MGCKVTHCLVGCKSRCALGASLHESTMSIGLQFFGLGRCAPPVPLRYQMPLGGGGGFWVSPSSSYCVGASSSCSIYLSFWFKLNFGFGFAAGWGGRFLS